MKLSELINLLTKAEACAAMTSPGFDPEVALCFEPSTMEEGFDWASTEGISDIRLVSDWPLPGKSLMVEEHEKPSKLVIFYDNHFNLDSSKE